MDKTKKAISFVMAAALALSPAVSVLSNYMTAYAVDDEAVLSRSDSTDISSESAQTSEEPEGQIEQMPEENTGVAEETEMLQDIEETESETEEMSDMERLSSYIKGDVMKLQDDVQIDDNYVLDPNVNVLDLNGFALSLYDNNNDNYYQLNVTGDLQITDSSQKQNGVIECDDITVSQASVVLRDGTINASSYGFVCSDDSEVTINGGTVNAGIASIISDNTSEDAYIEVKDGTLNAGCAAVFIQTPASLVVSGGVLNGGIGIRMGDVHISGGEINSITDQADSIETYFAYHGCVCLPDALYVLGGTAEGNESGSNAVNLEISGGIFNGYDHAAVVYDLGAVEQEIEVLISGGTFSSSPLADSFEVVKFADLSIGDTAITQDGEVSVSYNSNGTVSANGYIYGYYDNAVTAEISGGYFSSQTDDELMADGYTLEEDAGVYLAVEQAEHVHTEAIIEGFAPSCLEDGLTDGVCCSECGEILTEQEVIPALGHTVFIDEAVEPACTSDGRTQGSHCTVCGAIIEEQSLVPATGHDYVAVSSVDATCLTGGTITYQCQYCGDSYNETIPATGSHTVVVDSAIPATCTESGLTSGSHCSVCGQTLQAQTVVPAAGHTVVIDPATDTLTEGSHCSVCGEVLAAQQTIVTETAPESEYTPESEYVPESENTTAAEYTEGTEHIVETVYEEEPADTQHQHTIVIDEAVPATCTESGRTEGQHCSVCGDIIVEQEEIPAAGHTTYVETGYDAACSSSGLTDCVYCTVCGVILQEAAEIPPLDHTIEIEQGYDATCTEDGITDGEYCTVCGEILTYQEVIPALGHVLVIDEAVEPTCTEDGLTEGYHCSQCGEMFQIQETIEASGHTLEIDAGKSAACTTAGYTEGSHCSVCGEIIEKQTTIPAFGHDFQWVLDKEATTEEEGMRHQVCTICGETGETAVIPLIETESEDTALNIVINTEAEADIEAEDAASVQTNDSTPVRVWIIVAIAALCVFLGAGGYTIYRVRRKM